MFLNIPAASGPGAAFLPGKRAQKYGRTPDFCKKQVAVRQGLRV